MNSRVLIAGARAPVSLALTRQFYERQIRVDTMDSISNPMSRFSKKIDKYHEISSPRFKFSEFSNEIIDLQNQKSFDLIIPTCEEVFYFSKLKDKTNLKEIFCDRFEKLVELHSKWAFYLKSLSWSVQAPESFLLKSLEDWSKLKLASTDFVFKPVFSRFAAETLIAPNTEKLPTIDFSKGQWIAQRKISGDEICVYSVYHEGKLKAFCAYRPSYRVGLGAGIFLEPYYDEKLVQFCTEFAEKTNYHGQAAFDFIFDPKERRFWLLECNPRSTSGASFFDSKLVDCFYNLNSQVLFGDQKYPRMLASAMLIYGLPKNLKVKSWIRFFRDFNRGLDVIWDRDDKTPTFAQYISFAQFLKESLQTGKSVLQISSQDIEYNG